MKTLLSRVVTTAYHLEGEDEITLAAAVAVNIQIDREKIARLEAVAGSLVFALDAIRRINSSGQFYDKGGPQLVKMALAVAEGAGIGIGRNVFDVAREMGSREVAE